jgi:hypothetical protein
MIVRDAYVFTNQVTASPASRSLRMMWCSRPKKSRRVANGEHRRQAACNEYAHRARKMDQTTRNLTGLSFQSLQFLCPRIS